MMVQPKKPPISIRFPDDLMELVEAWATDRGLARNAALKALVELGLEDRSPAKPAARKAASKPAADPQPILKAARPAEKPAKLTLPRAAPGSRLKGAKK